MKEDFFNSIIIYLFLYAKKSKILNRNINKNFF